MRKIVIETKKPKEVINLTAKIEELLQKYPAHDGMVHLYLKHTTAALTTAYIEEDLDMIGAFDVIIPASSLAKTHTHHLGHLPAHIVASLLGPHLAIPVEKNKLQLGTFQNIVLVELNGPRKREITVHFKE